MDDFGFLMGLIALWVVVLGGVFTIAWASSNADHRNFVNSCHRTGGYVAPHSDSDGNGICVKHKLPGTW